MNDEELDLLRSTARDWLTAHCAARPDHHESRSAVLVRWTDMAQLGWTAALIPEAHGGSGLGLRAYAAIAEELGRETVVAPLLSSSLLAVQALEHCDSALAPDALRAIAEGRLVVGWAHDEGPRHGEALDATAQPDVLQWRLDGSKKFVLDGAVADKFLVTARIDGDPAVFLVDCDEVETATLDTIDGRPFAHVEFSAAAAMHIGGPEMVARLLDLGRLGIASEMLGAARRAFEITISYLKQRVQFDQPIGAFQALQHRVAELHVAIELAAACVNKGWSAAEEDRGDWTEVAVLANYMSSRALHATAREMVQLHGGIGMTAEHLAGRYLKWGMVSEKLFGDESHMTGLYADRGGF